MPKNPLDSFENPFSGTTNIFPEGSKNWQFINNFYQGTYAQHILGQDYEGYKELSPQQVAGMSDEDKLQWARAMTGDFSMTIDDVHQYFPQFDTEELAYKRETAADAVAGIGTGARGGLLKMAMDTTSTKARSGFSATGNPMIDKQRENVYRDMDQQMDTSFQASEYDESKLWTDFQQDWAERAIAYEESKDIKDAS